MPQTIVFLDDEEDTKIKRYAKFFRISKNDAIRKIIHENVDDALKDEAQEEGN